MSAKQHWNFAFAGTGVIGTVATVLTVADKHLRKEALYCLCGCVVWGVGASLYYALRAKRPMTVSLAHTEDESQAAWQLGNATYSRMRKHYPSEDLIKRWWRQYSLGIWICRDQNDDIWGYFSIWPVGKDTFAKLKDGALLEDQIDSKSIRSRDDGPHSYWYIADVCRTKKVPNHTKEVTEYMVNSLVATALKALVKRSQFAKTAEMVAFAESFPGSLWLKHFDFTLVNKQKRIWFKPVTRRHVSKRVDLCCSDMLTGEDKAREAIHGV